MRRSEFLDALSLNSLKNKDYVVIAATLFFMIMSVFAFVNFQADIEKIHFERMTTWWGVTISYIALTLLVLQLSFLAYLLFLYVKYKAVKAVSNEQLPTCTVIVPAYNEGKLVYETLLSLADSDYPHEKLQILSIDDGSKDDTWQWMLRAKAILGNRLTIYQQPKNMGKRHALYLGFKEGTGDVFVTVDSDSIVKEDTLRNLVSPFAVHAKCGAVAGNVRVLNKEKGLIPKMLNVSFVFSFEFVRSAQSAIGSVLCTPGALAAYRKDAVMNCLEDWMNQTFMGQPSDIGEDRAMTNMILKQGKHVLFQKNALVYTNIPEKYKSLYKMFIRWERSNVRENIMMSQFAFTKFRKESTIGPRILLVMQWVKVIMAYPLLLLLLFFVVTHPVLFVCTSLAGIFVFSSIQMFFYAKKYNISEAFLAYTYSVFYLFTLFWITPYAIATASRRGWLTRDLPAV
ncbi:glycosyltransferase [Paenimyroides aestuarii]|uniref:Glycosyltransferase family 2 protein n=1 Tax=Paenimyroides aestuarii TaxID=2968490 RepID=A0ABY5NW30_9FLAO|nr:glycosyltransferase [Paenimyroides aestuarii]UUV22821.1 glycosyltransferase family 2 protein [Paenimyroides aestuarii]